MSRRSTPSDPVEGLPHIDGYTLHRLIDRGGFSRVYEATQHPLERRVAIKVLDTPVVDAERRETFERECQVMGRLSGHANIVTVFASALTTDRRPCIVMELCEGTYRGNVALGIAEVVDVGAKLADALQAIHDAGVVHRDIKPHNVFVTTHAEPAIGDFGISSIEHERTIPGAAGFSIDYASPEVFEEGGAGPAGDVYSLGATLFHLATGRVPFPHTGAADDRLAATIHRIIATPAPALGRSDAPDALDRLLRRCMAKRPADRPADAGAVADELRRIQTRVGLPDRRDRLDRVRGHHDDTTEPPLPSVVASGPHAVAPARHDRPHDRRVAGDDRDDPGDHTVVRGDVAPVRTDADDRRDPDTEQATDPDAGVRSPNRRRLAIGAVVVALAALVVVVGTIAGGGDDDSDATTTTTTTAPLDEFEVVRAPTDLTVERIGSNGEGTAFRLTWSGPDDAAFQVLLVGTDDRRTVEAATYDWTVDDAGVAPCFEVRTIGAGGTRLSQSAAGPVCGA